MSPPKLHLFQENYITASGLGTPLGVNIGGKASAERVFATEFGRISMNRRQLMKMTVAAACVPAGSLATRAQTYPARPVRILVGFPPGGTTDIIARLMAQWLSERLSQQFIIENRSGASANIAAEAAARAAGDGYTLLMCVPEYAINASFFEKLNYNFLRDMVVIGSVMRSPLILETNPGLPARNVPEFVKFAKQNPAKVTTASFGTGSISHVAGELFKRSTGLEIIHVPYRGSAPLVTDLIGGQVQSAFDNLPASIEHIRAGKLRPLAVTTANRSQALPSVPAMAEFVPGFEASATIGIAAPVGTATEIVEKLNREINAGLANAKLRERLAELSASPLGGSPADYAEFFARETEKWSKVIREAGIKAE
jgi:tripartite-type tricarboxylate transporter receptor subunit TctC